MPMGIVAECSEGKKSLKGEVVKELGGQGVRGIIHVDFKKIPIMMAGLGMEIKMQNKVLFSMNEFNHKD